MMPIILAAFAFMQNGLRWLWEFLSSHFGQLVAVALIAWFWSAHRTNVKWEARIETERQAAVAAAKEESLRQAQAAREIAAAATARLVEEQELEKKLREQIEEFDKEESANEPRKPSCTPAVVRPCRVDDLFARRVRELDASAHHRKAGTPRRAR